MQYTSAQADGGVSATQLDERESSSFSGLSGGTGLEEPLLAGGAGISRLIHIGPGGRRITCDFHRFAAVLRDDLTVAAIGGREGVLLIGGVIRSPDLHVGAIG